MSSSYKTVQCKGELGGIISDAFSQFEELASEMRDAYDNMESGNLGATDRCQRYGEAADQLENMQEPDSSDLPEDLLTKTVEYSESVSTRKGRSASRAVRCSNACSMLYAVQAALDEYVNDTRDKVEEADPEVDTVDMQGWADSAEQLSSELGDAISEAEGVEFPGMYG